MIITMQGNWTVAVKLKKILFSAAFCGAGGDIGNGIHSGTPGISVYVTGSQWAIAIQNNPGARFQASDSKQTFPHQVGSHYAFDKPG